MKVYKQDAQQKCNIFNGTDKLFFPPFQKRRDIIWAYSHDACKSYPLRYAYMKTVRGAKTAWKTLDLKDQLVYIRIKRSAVYKQEHRTTCVQNLGCLKFDIFSECVTALLLV